MNDNYWHNGKLYPKMKTTPPKSVRDGRKGAKRAKYKRWLGFMTKKDRKVHLMLNRKVRMTLYRESA